MNDYVQLAIVLAVVVYAVVYVVRHIYRLTRKNGKCGGCPLSGKCAAADRTRSHCDRDKGSSCCH